jgi:hypothetical protein
MTMFDVREYERRAAEADEHARQAENVPLRRNWEQVADQWRFLAEHVRRKGR